MNKMIQTTRKERDNTGSGMDEFLDSLSRENRVLFIQRYWFCDTYAEIAVRFSISERKVKRQIRRTLEQLFDYLNRTGIPFGINHVNAKFLNEAESVSSLKEEKMYLLQFYPILIDSISAYKSHLAVRYQRRKQLQLEKLWTDF